jgi:hypothetical protein
LALLAAFTASQMDAHEAGLLSATLTWEKLFAMTS